jgi:hypothetical protein
METVLRYVAVALVMVLFVIHEQQLHLAGMLVPVTLLFLASVVAFYAWFRRAGL